MLVHKLTHPEQAELAIGAIDEQGNAFVNDWAAELDPVYLEASRAMLHECDAMVCLNVPADFYAVGQFFDDFSQVTDDEVVAILKQDVEKVSAVG